MDVYSVATKYEVSRAWVHRLVQRRRPDVAAARRRWHATLPLHDARGYVFLYESGVTTDLLRRYGRSPDV